MAAVKCACGRPVGGHRHADPPRCAGCCRECTPPLFEPTEVDVEPGEVAREAAAQLDRIVLRLFTDHEDAMTARDAAVRLKVWATGPQVRQSVDRLEAAHRLQRGQSVKEGKREVATYRLQAVSESTG